MLQYGVVKSDILKQKKCGKGENDMSNVIYTKDQIKEIIPHREPMLMIDEVTEMIPGKSITARFHLRPELDFFKGHFPEAPVMPGVLTVESMAQASDVLLLSCERYAKTIPYFIGIDSVRFRKKIEPNDTIEIKSVIENEIEDRATVTCYVEVWNGEALATTGKVTLAMR